VQQELNKEKRLTQLELNEYLRIWKKLKNDNKQMRIIKDKQITSVDENYFDNIILYHLQKEFKKGYTLGNLLGTMMTRYHLSDIFFDIRIKQLIDDKKIKVIEENKEKRYKSLIELGDNMKTEIEIRFLEIEKEKLIEKLENFEAYKVGEYLQRRYVYDFNPKILNKWIRLRNNGLTTTLTIKEIENNSIDGTKELEITVSDFDDTHEMLKQLGYVEKAYQENKRITYFMDDVEIDIDSWPLIPTYVELEAKTINAIENLINKLELDINKKTELNVQSIYKEIYKINIDDYKELKFEE
jgi:Adenylate cyclase, class 2 (thermophilic)